MTPEQKAKELIDRYAQIIGSNCEHDPYCLREECQTKDGGVWCKVDKAKSKEAATLAVEEILSLKMIWNMGRDNYQYSEGVFWENVKKELEKHP